MSNISKDYNFQGVAASIDGIPIEGFAEGDDVISAVFNSDISDEVTGADGESASSKLNDDSALITFNLLQTSKSNDLLNGYAVARTNFTLFIRDGNGATILIAKTANIKKRPDIGFGSTVGTREWVIATGKLEAIIGGSDNV